MTAVVVRPTSLIPAPRGPPLSGAPGTAALHPAAPRAHRLPCGGLPAGAAPAGAPRVAAARRAGHLGAGRRGRAHRDADPARRPHRPRPAAPPRRRTRPVWPALLRAVPTRKRRRPCGARRLDRRCARIDHMLRDVATAARQWQVADTARARDAFALACLDLADAVDAQTAEEEAVLLRCWASTSLPATGPRSPARRSAGSPAASSCWCSGWRWRTPRRRPRAAAQRALRPRPGWPGGCTADSQLPGGRRPAARRSAGPLTHGQ